MDLYWDVWQAFQCLASILAAMPEDATAFGNAVRRLRNKKSISLDQLAELAGMQRTYLGDIERGERNPALINMLKMAKALGVPLSKLILEMERES